MSRISGSKIMQTIATAKKAEFEYCRTHLDYFIDNYCVIEDKDSPNIIEPFSAWQAQREAIKSIHNNRLNIILKARQLGITWIALYYCCWDLIFNMGHTVVALSKTEEDAKELCRRLEVILSNMIPLLEGGGLSFVRTATAVAITDGKLTSIFKSFPASPSAGRSFTGNILLIDEWAYQDWAEEIWTSAYPTINRPTGGKVIGLSTIKRGTLFERLWTDDNAFNKIFLSCFADPRRTQEWYEQTEKDIGQRIKQEYPRTAEEALANLGGAFFPEFDYQLHTIDQFAVPDDWAIYTSMDYGLDKLAHYKYAIDNDRNVYVLNEIYQSNLLVSDAAEKIKDLDWRHNELGEVVPYQLPRCRLAPPDLYSKNPQTGKSIIDAFYEQEVYLTQASNNRESGWLQVKELLKPVLQADGTMRPRLRIMRNCVNLIRCMQTILIDSKNPKDCAREPHELTHAPDALRYFAIYWTSPAEPKEPPRRKWRDDWWEDYYNARSEEERVAIKRKYGEPEL